MRNLLALSVLLCACSQGDRLPPSLGDCDTCGNKSHDAGTVATQDAATQDVTADAPADVGSDVTTNDASNDASTNEAGSDADLDSSDDGALLDTGAGD